MAFPAPRVYIDGRRLDSGKDQESPVKAGLTIKAGADSYVDMSQPETLSLELLIRNPADLRFISLGHEIAVYHPGDAFLRETSFFVGRISNLEAYPDPDHKGSLCLAINATDTHTELSNGSRHDVDMFETHAVNRFAWINTLVPEGWEVGYFGADFPDRIHARVKQAGATFLELFDRWCRSQLMLRRVSSRFTLAGGTKLTVQAITDGTRGLRAALLGLFADGRWGVVYQAPGTNNVLIELHASNILDDPGWRKETEDLITAVDITSFQPAKDEASETPAKTTSSERRVRSSELIRRYGKRTIGFDTDLRWEDQPAVYAVQDHWLLNATGWRSTSFTIRDSDALSEQSLFYLLDSGQRMTAFAVVRGMYENRPDNHEADLRALIIGHTAVWNGKKWDITLTHGRALHEPDGGDWWTFARLEASTVPQFSAATAAGVGDIVSFRDFIRIGQPRV